MAGITNTQNITVEITPWTTHNFTLQWVQLKEELGGNLPTGKASFMFSRDSEQVSMLTEQNTGRLLLLDNNESGYQFNLPIFITDRYYSGISLIIEFVVIDDPRFFSDLVSSTYTNIDEAIRTLYPGYVDIRVDSDQNNYQPLHQNCETSLDFIRRLGLTFKSDIVFGYSFDGFLIKRIRGISSTGLDESNPQSLLPTVVGGGTGNLTNTTPYTMTYDRKSNYPIINPWEEEDNVLKTTYESMKPKNAISVIGSEYFICRAGYEDMLKNYLNTSVKYSTNFSGKYVLTGSIMPNNYRLGDLIRYRRADDSQYLKDSDSYTTCLVYSNEVFLGDGRDTYGPHRFNFEWNTELRCIDNAAWTQTEQEENIV